MNKNITFRTETSKIKALDSVASEMDRDRSYIINQAIENYLDNYNWQTEQIKLALKEAEAEDFATESDISRLNKKYKPK